MSGSVEGLISPPVSAASPSPSHGGIPLGSTLLPTPRQHALRPGSEKEIALINYLDSKMLHISRRYGKKFTDSETEQDDAPGYTDLAQVVADLDPLVDVTWVSGTTHLQTSYLLSFAGTLLAYLPAFVFSPSIFPLLSKLDSAFVALLRPPSSSSTNTASSHLSTTDKVRIKSLIEETRVTAVHCASSAGYSASVQDLSSSDESDTADDEEVGEGEAPFDTEAMSIEISKIYKRTLEILGDSLI